MLRITASAKRLVGTASFQTQVQPIRNWSMKLQIKVDPNTGKITDARFKTFGCGPAIASSSVATEWVKGKQMEEVLTIKNTEIAKHLSLPPVKLHCSMLAEDAIKAAVKDYEAKRASAAAGTTTT
ncbi:hypothetical protein TSUD_325730 [Trifolium subterraneum]|uniref:NIF system FeS cluster assembly NifU N-terminal domain-containing protein n=1 Tax=Trifolium subterraneum TaxID=3900 RepID=A0A2Z6LLS0_TRISU|nr:hypothetical protein TSUD_325730 [Trifolium subterraneum]